MSVVNKTKLRCPTFGFDGLLAPLASTQGVVFPYSPTVQLGHSARLMDHMIQHTVFINNNITSIHQIQHTVLQAHLLPKQTKMRITQQQHYTFLKHV